MESKVGVAVNPCCGKLKERYAKVEASRNALREGVKIQNELIDRLQNENLDLKKAYDEERARAEAERHEKENQVSLENKNNVVKSEVDGEVLTLRTRVSELETEINQLKDLVDKERMRADSERRKHLAVQQEASEALKDAKARADEKQELADTAQKKVEENGIQLVKLKSEADEARSKFEEANKKLEAERKKVIKEKKRADSEKAKAEEQRKLAEISQDKAMDEKRRADNLSQQLEEHRKRAEKFRMEIDTFEQRGGSQIVDGEVPALRVRVSELEAEINQLKDLVEKERMEADSERRKALAVNGEAQNNMKAEKSRADEKQELADIAQKKLENNRIQLEKLKSEADEARSRLASEAFKSEEATKKLEAERQEVIKEKKRADSEMTKAEEQKKLAEINQKKAMDERCRADCLSQQLEEHKETIEKLQMEIDKLVPLGKLGEFPANLSDKHMDAGTAEVNFGVRAAMLGREADETKLFLEQFNSKQADKRLKEEKQKVIREKKRADSEMRKAEDQRKVAEANKKKAVEEKSRADQLAQQLEDNNRRVEELQKEILELKKISEANKNKALEEKHRADQLAWQLEGNKQRIEELQKERLELVSSRTLVEAPVVLPDKSLNSETAKMKMLRKQLKFKKKEVKHAKEVAKLEIARNNMLQQEFCCLRQEFNHFSHRLDRLNSCFSHSSEGRDEMEKNVNIFNSPCLNLRRELFCTNPHAVHLHCNNALVKPSCKGIVASDCVKQTIECNAPSLPLTGGNCTQSISGIDSKLEPLLGGSNRKLLQSSAINSSTASFSDPLVGSQARGAFSVTKSAKLAEDSEPFISSLSGEVTKTRSKENLAAVAENSIRSPTCTDAVGRRAGNSKKRKSICDAVKSIEHLYSEGKKWHLQIEEKLSMLHGVLNSEVDNSLQQDRCMIHSLECNSDAEQVRAHKKRKISPEGELALQHLPDSVEWKDRLGTGGIEEAIFGNQTGLKTIALVCKDGIRDSGNSSQTNFACVEEALEQNYMKLLDLDDAVEEECYRRAIEMPLSPTLPIIGFHSGETVEIDSTKHPVDDNCVGFSSEKDNLLLCCSFNVMNGESHSDTVKLRTLESSHTQSTCENEGGVHPSKDVTSNDNGESYNVQKGNACAQQMWDSNPGLGTLDFCSVIQKGTNISCQSTIKPAYDELPRYCVVFSDTKDSSSISRIFRATGTCIAQCSRVALTDNLIGNIMHAHLKMELLPKEKACVFFSALLHFFSGLAFENFGSVLSRVSVLVLDSFAGCLRTVTSGVEAGNILAELCCFGELLVLIEDFLLEGRVLVYTPESFPTSGSGLNILLNELETILSHRAATTHQLIAGSIVLASLCAAIDNIGFLCEASYNIFRMQKLDSSVMLTILHVFAHVGGAKYFNLKDYSLMMTVMKSLVTSLESSDYIYSLHSADEARLEFPVCAKCPFSEGAVSMDIVVSILFKKLQNYASYDAMYQDLMESVNSSTSEALSCNEKVEKASGHEDRISLIKPVSDDNIFHFTDVLSLVELVACTMSWDWICKSVVSQMLKLLESCVSENMSIVTVSLLGKLGSIGVNARGYEANGAEILKSSLSALLYHNSSRKQALSIQIATAKALLGLISFNFEDLVKGSAELPTVASQSDTAMCIRKWYSMLSSEQQSLSCRVLQPDGTHSCRTR